MTRVRSAACVCVIFVCRWRRRINVDDVRLNGRVRLSLDAKEYIARAISSHHPHVASKRLLLDGCARLNIGVFLLVASVRDPHELSTRVDAAIGERDLQRDQSVRHENAPPRTRRTHSQSAAVGVGVLPPCALSGSTARPLECVVGEHTLAAAAGTSGAAVAAR